MKTDTKSIGKRLKYLREYSGLSRERFGRLFDSEEGTVGAWETGRCVPRLAKLISISIYFDISLDCLLSGKAMGESLLEESLSLIFRDNAYVRARARGTGQMISRYNSLSDKNKERLVGYLDALSRKNDM